ncbi:hypothetical protein C9I49_24095 [Pseudomonas prosekii]|uniref:Uncharacterized protein n=1 Tax=Pseudomonas prosekii TaxID=1148509 RepID=A0A2U2D1Z0_9PSED|nr:hypothetical protein C9I49_24095 [Pseudomonas prosekii]
MPRVYGKAVKKIERPSLKAGDWVTVETLRCLVVQARETGGWQVLLHPVNPETRGIAWRVSEWVFIGDRHPNVLADSRLAPFVEMLRKG